MFTKMDLGRTAFRLAEDSHGAMPRPPEAEVCEARETTAKVDRRGSVVDAPPGQVVGAVLLTLPQDQRFIMAIDALPA